MSIDLLKSAALAAVVTMSVAVPAKALVLHPVNDPPIGLLKPADAVVGQWLGVNQASIVVIDPNFAITTKHQGGGTGTDVSINGTLYNVAEIFAHPTADLRVIRLETLGGAPANLSDYVAIYQDTDEVGQVGVYGGYGEGRGTPVTGGYNWAGDLTRALRWGANRIDNTGVGGTSNVLIADFDLNGVFAEATLTEGDSGGGVFLWDAIDNRWEVAGLHRAVQFPEVARYSPTPELLDAVRLSSYTTFISDNVPEPGSATLLLTAATGLLLRRRRC